MLSRIRNLFSIDYIKNNLTALTNSVINFFVAELRQLPNKAEFADNGVGIVQEFNRNIVLVKPTRDQSSVKIQNQIKQLMDLKEVNSRVPYSCVSFFTNADFFVSKNDDKAFAMRKKIIPYLSPNQLKSDFSQEIKDLLYQLSANNNIPRDSVFSHHFIDMLMKRLAGIELNEKMKDYLLEIEHMQESIHVLFLTFVPHSILRWTPPYWGLRKKYDSEIRQFLREQILQICEQDEKNVNKNSWFVKTILEKSQKLKLSDISNSEIKKLIVDPNVRTCFGIVLGITNLTRNLLPTLYRLFATSQSFSSIKLLENLQHEILSHTSSSEDILDKESMPILHAVYLETLRHGANGFGFMRYTETGIKVDDINIPPKSFVTYLFDSAMKHAIEQYPEKDFRPERFLDEEFRLNENDILDKGLFTPFGVGTRMCPGKRIAELILKSYLVEFARHVKCFTDSSIMFNDPEFSEKLETRALLKNSFFESSTKNINSKKAIENAVALIREYSDEKEGLYPKNIRF